MSWGAPGPLARRRSNGIDSLRRLAITTVIASRRTLGRSDTAIRNRKKMPFGIGSMPAAHAARAAASALRAFFRVPERICFGWSRLIRSLPSWSAKADHPRVFKALETKTKRGWSAFADHDGEEAEVKALPSGTDRLYFVVTRAVPWRRGAPRPDPLPRGGRAGRRLRRRGGRAPGPAASRRSGSARPHRRACSSCASIRRCAGARAPGSAPGR